MSLSIFVPQDGFTLLGFIPASLGEHPDIWFSYRPGTMAVRLQWSEATGSAAKEQAGAEIISRHVVAIYAERRDSEPVRVTAEQAKTLWPNVFQSMVFHTIGYLGPSVEDGAKKSVAA
jgi:hypothetical protein